MFKINISKIYIYLPSFPAVLLPYNTHFQVLYLQYITCSFQDKRVINFLVSQEKQVRVSVRGHHCLQC